MKPVPQAAVFALIGYNALTPTERNPFMRSSVALQIHRDAIREIALRQRAKNVRVFGSVLQGDDTEHQHQPSKSSASRKHAKREQEPWLLVVSPSLKAFSAARAWLITEAACKLRKACETQKVRIMAWILPAKAGLKPNAAPTSY